MRAWIDEVQAAMNTIVFNIGTIETRLILIILIILLINEINDGLPTACVKTTLLKLTFLSITYACMKSYSVYVCTNVSLWCKKTVYTAYK